MRELSRNECAKTIEALGGITHNVSPRLFEIFSQILEGGWTIDEKWIPTPIHLEGRQVLEVELYKLYTPEECDSCGKDDFITGGDWDV